MMRHTLLNANPVFERLVDKLMLEDRRMDQTERRSAMRQSISRPALVFFREVDDPFTAYARNISPLGISLISETRFQENSQAKIEIYSPSEVSPTIVSEIRWCKPFGPKWFVSGWRFITLATSSG